MQSYRKQSGGTSSKVFRKLERLNELLAHFDDDREKMMDWAKQEAEKDTAAYRSKTKAMTITLSQTSYIPKDEERSFNAGYLFLQ